MPPFKGRTPMSTASTASRVSRFPRTSRVSRKSKTPMKRAATKRHTARVRGSKPHFLDRNKLEKMPMSRIIESLKKFKQDKDIEYLCLFDIGHIADFKRFIDSNVDCVASVMQLIGIIDIYTANILRILGIKMNQNEIVGIITLFAGYKLETNPFKYMFKDVTDLIIDETGQNPPSQSNELLKIGENQCVFMWIDFFDGGVGKSHCVCLLKDGSILKMVDPQLSHGERIIKIDDYFKKFESIVSIQLLYRNNKTLTEKELEDMGFTGIDGTADLRYPALPLI